MAFLLRKTAPTLLALAATVAFVAPAAASAAAPVSAYDSLAVLRPEQAPPAGGTSAVSLEAARNETESFQLSIAPTGSSLAGVEIEIGTLSGPGGATIPAEDVTVYREGTYKVGQRSDGEGAGGSWPDVLVPKRDPLYGEARTAFPVDVAAGSQLGVWVDVLVPIEAPAGTYRGTVTVSAASANVAEVPVTLEVADFALPSTSAFKSAFHVDPWQLCKAFTNEYTCPGQTEGWRLEQLVAELGLDNRVTISNPYPTGYNAAPTSTTQKENFARYIVPLLNGTDSRVRLPGAELTSFDAYWQCVTESTNCLGEWKKLATEYGFSERFFLYACDEPGSAAAWSTCATTAKTAEQRWSGVRKLVTAPVGELQQNTAGSYTTIDTPVVNDLNSGSVNRRPEYDNYLSKNSGSNELWIYNSCLSFSCDASESSVWNGWPGYAIDEPASQAQAMGWMAFAYQASGELYYQTTQSLPTASTNQYYAGGNGDGNLFYAGTPTGAYGSVAIGGNRSIPLETIRLKRIRDGYEDYEYLRLASQAAGRPAVMSVVEGLYGGLATAMNHTTVSGAQVEAARATLSTMIAPRTTEAPSSPPADEQVTPPSEEQVIPPVVEGSSAPATEAPVSAPAPQASPPVGALTSATAESSPASPQSVPAAAQTAPSPPPVARVLAVRAPKRADALVRSGARVLVSCTSRCQVSATAVIGKALARKLGLATPAVGEASAMISGRRWIVIQPSGDTARKLTAGGSAAGPVTLTAQVSVEAA